MKRFHFLKAFVLSCFVAAVFMLPSSLNAQKNDMFFRIENEDIYNDRVGEGFNITNYGVGEPVPVGSGLLILALTGAGYAVARRNRKGSRLVSKSGTLLLAFALLLGMTQCKKNVEQIAQNNGSDIEGVYITLNVNDGSKVIVEPEGTSHPDWATVNFEDNDKIYVGNNGQYCGYLTYSTSTGVFGGYINPTSEADYLHLYFLGNKAGDLNEGDTSCTFDIIDQTVKYPIVSYARTKSLYISGKTDYEARLQNYCSIVKFVTSYPTTKTLSITGMNNQVTVDFGANIATTSASPFTYSKTDETGEIKLHAEGTEGTVKWAIILPQDEAVAAKATAKGLRSTKTFSIPALPENTYYTNNGDGIRIILGLPGVYQTTGHQIVFAPGNVQYHPANNKWRFAEHQYDRVGADNQNISATYNGWIDLFGWGTGNNPTLASNDNNDYPKGQTKDRPMRRVNDWGNNFDYNIWYTMAATDWVDIMNRHADVGGSIRSLYTNATVNGVKGLLLLPDNWMDVSSESPVTITLPLTTQKGGDFTDCVIDASDWEDLEDLGCVFLPISGYRNPGYSNQIYNLDEWGYYWTSIEANSDTGARYLRINKNNTGIQASTESRYKCFGQSVRLIYYVY